jgi:hypothetical protein
MKRVQIRLDHLWVQDQRRRAVGESMVAAAARCADLSSVPSSG